MAANFRPNAGISNRPTNILVNQENKAPALNDRAKLKKEVKPAQLSGSSRLGSSASFSQRGSSQLGVVASIRNRTLGSSNLLTNMRSQKTLEAAKAAESRVKPEDWIIIPKAKPSDVYNIDTDLESHLMCPSLAPAQYAYLMMVEDKFMTDTGFLEQTKIDAHQRITILNWMTTVHRQFAEQQESLFLAINYFDRFMAANPNGSMLVGPNLSPFSMAQRIAATALYVACKYEEIYAPSIDQIAGSTENPRATPPEIRRIEFEMLRSLRFRVNPPLLNHFLRRCSKAAGATAMLHSLGKYLIEISLYDPDLATGTKGSLLAAACSYIAILVFGERTHIWDETMKYYSGGYTEADLKPVAAKLIAIHRQLVNREGSLLVKAKWDDMVRNPDFVAWVRDSNF